MDEGKDHLKRRCPRLGGSVAFHYCRLCGDDDLPCWKIFDCWWELFEITTYLKKNLAEDQFNKLTATKPKPKIRSLVELIEEAQNRRD